MRQLHTTFVAFWISAIFALPSVIALSSNSNRRNFLKQLSVSTAFVASPAVAALDMDAFISESIQQDKPKEMTDDERTCKYAAPGKAKGEACTRAGMAIEAKGGKGVNAFGETDRGDFVRCKITYPIVDGKCIKTITCQ